MLRIRLREVFPPEMPLVKMPLIDLGSMVNRGRIIPEQQARLARARGLLTVASLAVAHSLKRTACPAVFKRAASSSIDSRFSNAPFVAIELGELHFQHLVHATLRRV